jgi:hypothetical protein
MKGLSLSSMKSHPAVSAHFSLDDVPIFRGFWLLNKWVEAQDMIHVDFTGREVLCSYKFKLLFIT